MWARSGFWATAASAVAALALVCTGPAKLTAQDADRLQDVGYVLGDPTAPVQVIEFGDFACSACGEFWRETWPHVRTELIETGRVSWRHVPFLLGFDRGDIAANAAECAAEQGRFWPMHDRLFENQTEWLRGRRPEQLFMSYAAAIGLDLPAFRHCYDEEAGEGRTRAATRAARDAGVRATPTFFIGGRPALGALTFEMFLPLIDEAEAKAGPRR